MAAKYLLISDGLLAHSSGDGYVLNPALFEWQAMLSAYKRRWYATKPKMLQEWYAAINNCDVAALFDDFQHENIQQYWLVSPFHAQLTRDKMRVLPNSMLAWCADDAKWLCEVLNPLLADDGMYLQAQGAALLLLSEQVLDADMIPFAAISGALLPNRHPQGADANRMMRLIAEIQMFMSQQYCERRQQAGELPLHGLWLWASGLTADIRQAQHSFAVATRNPDLQALVDAKDAKVIFTEADFLGDLTLSGERLPSHIVLAGTEHAVLLRHAFIPKRKQDTWQPVKVEQEDTLLQQLRMCYAN